MKKSLKVGAFLVVALLVCFGFTYAQAAPVTIDPAVVAAILSGVWLLGGGLPVSALTELLKRLIFPNEETRPKWSGYVCSAIVCVACTGGYLLVFKIFTLAGFLIYSVVTWLEANGLYKYAAKT